MAFLENVEIDKLKNFIVTKAELVLNLETCRVSGCGTPIKNVYTLSDDKGNYTYVGSECIKKINKLNNVNCIECSDDVDKKFIKLIKIDKNEIDDWELPF